MKLPYVIADRLLQGNFDALLKTITSNIARLDVLEVLGLTKRTRGVANIVISVAAVSGSTTGITHGLGTTPAAMLVSAQVSGAGLAITTLNNIGATTFDVGLRFSDGVARTGTFPVGWEAIA